MLYRPDEAYRLIHIHAMVWSTLLLPTWSSVYTVDLIPLKSLGSKNDLDIARLDVNQ